MNAFDLKIVVKAIRSFGLRRACLLFFSYLRLRVLRRGSLAIIKVPDISCPVYFRPGTSDWYTLCQIFIDQDYDFSLWPDHFRAIEEHYGCLLEASKTPVIVDCGANVGHAAVWFAEKFPKAIIYAIEPEPGNFSILQENAAQCQNIVAIHAGVLDRESCLSLSNPGSESWAWETRETESGDIKTITIPSIFARSSSQAPLIIKIDIEGSEVDLFRSNVDWVKSVPLIIIETHDWLGGWRGTGHAVYSRLSTHPRDYIHRHENMFAFAHTVRGSKQNAAASVRETRG
jgi:FkbM family methyltransferase